VGKFLGTRKSPCFRALKRLFQIARTSVIITKNTMEGIEVEYSREWKPLEAVLSGVKQPGEFFAFCAVEMPMPRVEVVGVGTLSFPVPEAQIAAIVQRAEKAPYGRGEQTIVDTSVRNVWPLAPTSVKIDGKSWDCSTNRSDHRAAASNDGGVRQQHSASVDRRGGVPPPP